MGWDYSYVDGGDTIVGQLEDLGYEKQFEYGEWGYDWNITEVWTKDGRVFTLTDGGCSCSSFGDRWSSLENAIEDMVEVSSLPSATEIGESHYYLDESAEIIQEKYRALGLR